MKVLQINVVYKIGSTGKICDSIDCELKEEGIESFVCFSRSEKTNDKNKYRVCGKLYSNLNKVLSTIFGKPYSFCLISTNRIIKFIKKQKPDIVHLHCLNGNFVNIYKLLNFLKKNNIRTVLTLHAEFMYTGGCAYSQECIKWKTGCEKCQYAKEKFGSMFFDTSKSNFKRMSNAFKGFNNLVIVGVSEWISNRAKQSKILSSKKILTIKNGIDVADFKPRDVDTKFYNHYMIPLNKKVVLSVISLFGEKNKGGDLILKAKNLLKDKYSFVVIGSKVDDPDIISIPFVKSKEELSRFYSMASVFAFTSRYENFPTVCIEANCCGTPIVAYDIGGVKETIGTDMGVAISPFNINEFCKAIEEKSNIKLDKYNVKSYRQYFSQKRMVADYIQLYKGMMKEDE